MKKEILRHSNMLGNYLGEKEKEYKYKCKKCGETFQDSKTYKKHLKICK